MPNDVKPRVLIFSLAYFPIVGGAEIAVKEITDQLAGEFDFDLITLRFGSSHLSRETMGSVNVFRINGHKLSFPFKAALLARKLHKQKEYKVVWSIMAAYAGFGTLFFKLMYPKVPMLLTLQEGDSEKHILKRVGLLYPLWKMIFKKADYIQVISNYLASFAKRHGAICPIEVVPNGVNLKKFSIFNFQFSNKPKNPDVKTIITTSRLVYKNGVDILIRAVAELKRKTSDVQVDIRCLKVKLLILGDGPDKKSLEGLSVELGVADIVKFIGHINPDDVPKYLAEADVFVRPARSEGLGNSFLEAMAAGLPVIGTPVGGIPDFLKDGETGIFCRVDDPKDLAEKIIRVLNDTELSRKLSENGRKLVEARYSWDGIASKIKAILNSLDAKPYTSSSLRISEPNGLNPRILLATGIYPPDIGGPATYASLLVKELPKRGVGVKVVTYGPSGVSRGLPKGIRHLVYFWICFKKALISDVVLTQDTISAGLPALIATRLARKRFIIRVPGDYVWEQSVQRFGVKENIDDFQNKRYGFRVEFLRSIQKFVVGHADTVITPSVYFRDLVRMWVKNKDKVITIYNGIDLSTSSKIQATRFKTIVSVGRLVPWKGFDMVIAMMLDLPEWKLIIIGDGPEYGNLKSQISNLNLGERVKLTGAIQRDMVLEYLSQAEVFVLNTSFESFSFQIVEAMSLGLPVVTTNIGNISEIIRNGIDGLLVSPNDKKGFLDSIRKISDSEELRKKISENAIARSKDFSIEITINNLVEILNK